MATQVVDFAGIASLVTAVAVLVAVVGNIFLTRRQLNKHGITLGDIDHAVNGKPPGETTLVSQIQDITDQNLALDDVGIVPLIRLIATEIAKQKGEENGSGPIEVRKP